MRGANGAVRMVKLNIDENPEIAQQMRIQSIPAVYAFKDGRPVDGFVGAVPESQIKQFVQRLGGGRGGPSPVEEAMAMAKEAMQSGDHASAGGALFADPAARARQHRGARRAGAGDDRARRTRPGAASCSTGCRRRAPTTPRSPAARSALDLAEQAQKAMGSAGKLRARLEQNADDHEARLELATALFGAGEREAAIDELLTLFKRDREWNEQAARKQLVKFFEVDGADRPADPERAAAAVVADVLVTASARVMSEPRRRSALPEILPIFPLTGVLLLPRGRLPLNIFEPRYLAMTRDALAGERLIGMVQPSDPRDRRDEPARSIRSAAPAASPRFPRPMTAAI